MLERASGGDNNLTDLERVIILMGLQTNFSVRTDRWRWSRGNPLFPSRLSISNGDLLCTFRSNSLISVKRSLKSCGSCSITVKKTKY